MAATGAPQGAGYGICCATSAATSAQSSNWGGGKRSIPGAARLSPPIASWTSIPEKRWLGLGDDLVDVARQALANYALLVHWKIVRAYQQHNSATFQKHSKSFLAFIDDINQLLATRYREYIFLFHLESEGLLMTSSAMEG
jgi:hypothetical protein